MTRSAKFYKVLKFGDKISLNSHVFIIPAVFRRPADFVENRWGA